MPDGPTKREMLAIRLRLQAAFHTEIAAKMANIEQPELARHFLQTAELMLEAGRELNQ